MAGTSPAMTDKGRESMNNAVNNKRVFCVQPHRPIGFVEIIGKRESKSRPGAGIVEFHHRMYNQSDKLVAECRRSVFMVMRPK